MQARLYVVHGSHPCVAVARALELKGIPYKTVELPPPLHAPIQRVLFGRRTVPGLRLGGERLVGSREIVRRLDELRPDPPLFPADPEARRRVEEAEAWAEEVIQSMARRFVWFGMRRCPDAIVTFTEHSKLAAPAPLLRMSAPLIVRGEWALNDISEAAVRADRAALPGHLDRVDGWIEEGVLGGETPNAADLQVATTLRLMMTLDDLRPLIEWRPAGELALRLFPEADGRLPAGALPEAAKAPAIA